MLKVSLGPCGPAFFMARRSNSAARLAAPSYEFTTLFRHALENVLYE
jgi:hypothetical protein